MGMPRFRRAKITETAAGKATDLIRAKTINANDDVYGGLALAA